MAGAGGEQTGLGMEGVSEVRLVRWVRWVRFVQGFLAA